MIQQVDGADSLYRDAFLSIATSRTNQYQLIALHWLPIKYRVEFKIVLLVYKVLNNMAPIYISELLIPKPSCERWTLRSDDQGLLHIPKTNCKTLGDRSFAYAAPQLWNSLPLNVRNCDSISVFKKRLKTFLFRKAFNL